MKPGPSRKARGIKMPEINPWGNDLVDYRKLFTQFGMQRVSPGLHHRLRASRFFRRGIVFAHRDLDQFAQAADS